MSLNFDLTAIADRETNYPPVRNEQGEAIAWNRTTEAIIWSTVSTDIGHFKDEDTAREAFRRWEVLGYADGTPGALTVEDFIGHVGIRTNVFNTGKRAFAAKVKRIHAMRAADEKRRVASRAGKELVPA